MEHTAEENMKIIEDRLEEINSSQELSKSEVNPDGSITEKLEMSTKKLEQTSQKVEDAGGFEALVAKLPEDRVAYWQNKSDEAYNKQMGLENGTTGGKGHENGLQGFLERYYTFRAFLAKMEAKFK